MPIRIEHPDGRTYVIYGGMAQFRRLYEPAGFTVSEVFGVDEEPGQDAVVDERPARRRRAAEPEPAPEPAPAPEPEP